MAAIAEGVIGGAFLFAPFSCRPDKRKEKPIARDLEWRNISSFAAELFFDSQELVVLAHPVRPRG